MRVLPHPDLPLEQYLPGIGAEGADLPDEEAKELIGRGLAVAADKPKKAAAPATEPQE